MLKSMCFLVTHFGGEMVTIYGKVPDYEKEQEKFLSEIKMQ